MTCGGANSSVKKLDLDGNIVATYTTAPNPTAITFDGVNMWITHVPGGATPGALYKLRASDGAVLGIFEVGGGAYEAVFDGTNILVANVHSNTISKR